MAANTWKRKTRKRRPGYQTVRRSYFNYPDSEENAHQLATELMGNEDFRDAPETLQNEEIRELATTMHNKKAVKQEVKHAKKEKKPSAFKTMTYSVSLVSIL